MNRAYYNFKDYENQELREIISAIETLRDYNVHVSQELEDEIYREIEKREEKGVFQYHQTKNKE